MFPRHRYPSVPAACARSPLPAVPQPAGAPVSWAPAPTRAALAFKDLRVFTAWWRKGGPGRWSGPLPSVSMAVLNAEAACASLPICSTPQGPLAALLTLARQMAKPTMSRKCHTAQPICVIPLLQRAAIQVRRQRMIEAVRALQAAEPAPHCKRPARTWPARRGSWRSASASLAPEHAGARLILCWRLTPPPLPAPARGLSGSVSSSSCLSVVSALATFLILTDLTPDRAARGGRLRRPVRQPAAGDRDGGGHRGARARDCGAPGRRRLRAPACTSASSPSSASLRRCPRCCSPLPPPPPSRVRSTTGSTSRPCRSCSTRSTSRTPTSTSTGR